MTSSLARPPEYNVGRSSGDYGPASQQHHLCCVTAHGVNVVENGEHPDATVDEIVDDTHGGSPVRGVERRHRLIEQQYPGRRQRGGPP